MFFYLGFITGPIEILILASFYPFVCFLYTGGNDLNFGGIWGYYCLDRTIGGKNGITIMALDNVKSLWAVDILIGILVSCHTPFFSFYKRPFFSKRHGAEFCRDFWDKLRECPGIYYIWGPFPRINKKK